MTDTYYLRLGEHPHQLLRWAHATQIGQGTLAEFAALAEGAAVVVLAPASRLLCLSTPMPSLSGARLQQALPFALEEQLAEEVESLHFVAGPRTGDGQQTALVVAKQDMQQWLALLTAHGIRPQRMLHEGLALPWQEGSWSLCLEDEQALLRTGPADVAVLPITDWPGWLALAWPRRREGVQQLAIYDARQNPLEVDARELPDGVVISQYQVSAPILRHMLTELEHTPAINLLSGEFSSRERLSKLWRPWRTAAALLGIWLLLQGTLAFSQYQQLKQQDEALYQAIIETYRKAFPDAVNIVHPRLQMERHLEQLRASGGQSTFVNLLNTTGPLLADRQQIQLGNLRYRQGELELELVLNTMAQLETLQTQLSERGLQVENRGATTRNEQLEVRLVIREQGQ